MTLYESLPRFDFLPASAHNAPDIAFRWEPMKKILIVDDESHIVWIVEKRLRANGYDPIVAFSGTEGLEKARQTKPALILLDIMMPGINGYVTLQQLQAHAETKHIPVIMFTAKGRMQDVQQAIDMGAIDFIIKPFEPESFLEKIRLAIGKET